MFVCTTRVSSGHKIEGSFLPMTASLLKEQQMYVNVTLAGNNTGVRNQSGHRKPRSGQKRAIISRMQVKFD